MTTPLVDLKDNSAPKLIGCIRFYFNKNMPEKLIWPFADGYMVRSLEALEEIVAEAGESLKVMKPEQKQTFVTPIVDTDAPTCKICGTLMQRNGSCHVCPACGSTDGCS